MQVVPSVPRSYVPDSSGFALYVNFFPCIKLLYAGHVKLTAQNMVAEVQSVQSNIDFEDLFYFNSI